MRRFILKAILFFSPIIILLYGADVFLSKNLAKSNLGENSIWKDVYHGTVNADIVIYGASRAIEHIDPKVIADTLHQSTYNLGVYAYDFTLQYLRHKLFLQHNKQPKLIIHSLDFLTFQKRTGLFDPGQFLPYMLYDTLMKKYTQNYTGYTAYDYAIPLVRYYAKGQDIHHAISLFINKKPEHPDRIRGYFSMDQKFVLTFNEGIKDVKPYYEIVFDKPTISLFDKYLAECRTANIKVVFVYTPEYTYGQRFIKNRKQLFELIHYFSKKYGIPFYDYSNDVMCTNTAFFYNSEHLNTAGSQLFSKKFASDLKHGKIQ